MTLPIDSLVAKATAGDTQMSSFTYLVPHIWAPEIEKNLRRLSVLQQTLVQDTSLLESPGDYVIIPTLPDVLDLVSDLTEDTDIVVAKLGPDSSVTLTPTETGGGIQLTRKLLDRMNYDGMALAVDRLAYSMQYTIESKIASLYSGLEAAGSKAYTSDSITSVDSITASNIANDFMFLAGQNFLRKKENFPFPNGNYSVFLHPDQWKSLMQDTNVRNDLRFANPQAVMSNESMRNAFVGVHHNCDIYVTSYIPKVNNAGAVPVYKSLMVAPRWAAIAWKRKPAMVIDPTLYDFGRRRKVGITADYATALLHSDRAVVIETA